MIVVDSAATDGVGRLLDRYPDLGNHVELIAVDAPADDPGLTVDASHFGERDRSGLVVVSLADESEAILTGLRLAHRVPPEIPVVVQTYTRGGLSALIKRQATASASVRLAAFPLLEETCDYESLRSGTLELLAQAVHESYLATACPRSRPTASEEHTDRASEEHTDRASESAGWRELDESLKASKSISRGWYRTSSEEARVRDRPALVDRSPPLPVLRHRARRVGAGGTPSLDGRATRGRLDTRREEGPRDEDSSGSRRLGGSDR